MGEKKKGEMPDCGGELDFMSAIEAHVRWKVRLEGYITGLSDESLDPEQIGRDDQCLLGQWIHGPGRDAYAGQQRFENVKTIHAKFHQCAADIVRTVDGGEADKAKAMLCKGDYAIHSHRIKAELARLALELDD